MSLVIYKTLNNLNSDPANEVKAALTYLNNNNGNEKELLDRIAPWPLRRQLQRVNREAGF